MILTININKGGIEKIICSILAIMVYVHSNYYGL